MPEFTYIAITKDGHKENATINAVSAAVAGHLLKEQGLLPTEIKEKGAGNSGIRLFKSFSRVSLDEKITFIENLSIMIKAGISVPRSLQILARQTGNKGFQVILNDVYSQVESGKSLGEALAKYSSTFSNIFVSMVKVGELSGNLDKSLEYLVIQLKREGELKSKTKGAMMYPAVIVSAMLVIGILMSIYVLPSLTATFKDSAVALPITTRIVIAFSDFMSAHAIIVIGGLLVCIGGFIAGLRTENGQRALDFVLLHFYILNAIVKKINLARFARILSSLLKSGIPILEALEVVSASLGNAYYRDFTEQAAKDVKVGKALSESIGTDNSMFPMLMIQMLQVGEESGTVETILDQIATHYEADVDNVLNNLSSILEPLLLLVIGGVVGFLALALIAPIYNIGQSIN